MQTFSSKVDLWLLLVLLLAVAVCVLGAFDAIRTGRWAIALIVLLGGVGFPVWLLLSTRYVVADSALVIRSGPFRWQVPVASISSVEATTNPISSPALSLDRLAINYDNGKRVLVSPKDKAAFRAAIGK